MPGETPLAQVARLARIKAEAGVTGHPGAYVIGSDTMVVLDGEALGKPGTPSRAAEMLSRLSGRTHWVYTSVALASAERTTVTTQRSHVTFRPLSPDDIAAYCESSEPLDKAGGYGIQGFAATFVSNLEGSYSGVMGLPLFETAELLRAFGLNPRPPA